VRAKSDWKNSDLAPHSAAMILAYFLNIGYTFKSSIQKSFNLALRVGFAVIIFDREL
jgi:putative flippase GtrA